MKVKMEELQKILLTKKIIDFEFLEYKDFTLKVAASFDFSYYHNVEIIFYGVSYIACATKLINTEIRFGTKEEREQLLKSKRISYMEDDEILFCFSIFNDLDKHYILAEGFDYEVKDVRYKK